MPLPDLASDQPFLIGEAAAHSAGASRNADSVRYLSELWGNLLAIQELLEVDRAAPAG